MDAEKLNIFPCRLLAVKTHRGLFFGKAEKNVHLCSQNISVRPEYAG